MSIIEYGFCHCGCGERTNINKGNDKHGGLVKGEPKKYIANHCHTGREAEPLEDKYSPEPMSGCWLWTAGLSDTGYGAIWNSLLKRIENAHRYMYQLLIGPVPEGLELDHKCRTRCCVNPWHLEPVTRKENARRGAGTLLTMEQVNEIHSLHKNEGLGSRRLAKKFNVHRSTMISLLTRRNWKDAA